MSEETIQIDGQLALDLNPRNEELFYKIAAAIEEQPHKWRQDYWVSYLNPEIGHSDNIIAVDARHEWCETAYCIAGWAMTLSGEDQVVEEKAWVDGSEYAVIDFSVEVGEVGRDLLGLTNAEAGRLFHGGMRSVDSPVEMAGEVAEALRAIGRGENVWDALPSWW